MRASFSTTAPLSHTVRAFSSSHGRAVAVLCRNWTLNHTHCQLSAQGSTGVLVQLTQESTLVHRWSLQVTATALAAIPAHSSGHTCHSRTHRILLQPGVQRRAASHHLRHDDRSDMAAGNAGIHAAVGWKARAQGHSKQRKAQVSTCICCLGGQQKQHWDVHWW